jgi:hypothetical protein
MKNLEGLLGLDIFGLMGKIELKFINLINKVRDNIGYKPTVEIYGGYGNTEKIHLFGRVFMPLTRRKVSLVGRGFRTLFVA